jgi:hypothetical protein
LHILKESKATFSSVYACFVVIKYHLTKLNGFVQDAFSLDDNNIEKMMTSMSTDLQTIYSPAHALSFSTDPMFAALYKRITGELKSKFLQLGKGSNNLTMQGCSIRRVNCDEEHCQKRFSEYVNFLMNSKDDDNIDLRTH